MSSVAEAVMVESHSENLLQLVSFNLGKEEFAVDILKIQEINRMVEITKVPKSPEFVEGVINLRGKVIPIIDLRKRFNLPGSDISKQTRIVVVDIDNKVVGLVVDAVSEVLRLPASTVEPTPPIVAGIDSEYINGVGKLEDRLLILLDLNKILSKSEKMDLDASINKKGVPLVEKSLYEKIGGEKAVDAAVELFYKKVLQDDRIKGFFDGLDMKRLVKKQKAFLTYAFGGPNRYDGQTMRAAHAKLVEKGLNDSHFDAVMENLGSTLKELGVADNLVNEAARIAEGTRKDVLGK